MASHSSQLVIIQAFDISWIWFAMMTAGGQISANRAIRTFRSFFRMSIRMVHPTGCEMRERRSSRPFQKIPPCCDGWLVTWLLGLIFFGQEGRQEGEQPPALLMLRIYWMKRWTSSSCTAVLLILETRHRAEDEYCKGSLRDITTDHQRCCRDQESCRILSPVVDVRYSIPSWRPRWIRDHYRAATWLFIADGRWASSQHNPFFSWKMSSFLPREDHCLLRVFPVEIMKARRGI